MQNIKKFIFQDSATIYFYDLLDSFHKSFSDVVLMSGIGYNGQTIKEIIFENNIYFPDSFYELIIKNFSRLQPSVICQALRRNRLEMECMYYDFGKIDGIKHVYLIKNTMDWTSKNNFNCEVWNLLPIDIEDVKYHWIQNQNEYI
jgi:hypothetical protein